MAPATKTASVPCASSGAWKAILPRTSLAAISVSPVCKVNTIGLSSAVATCFKLSPVSAAWVNVISWSLPKYIIPPSAKYKSDHSADAVPNESPSAEAGSEPPI